MAEINAGDRRIPSRSGRRQGKKLSTKVDLTPMVDLGFLLITFFIFTTAMSTPRTIKMYLPAGERPDMPVKESTVLTIVPISGNQVFYYSGDLFTAIQKNLYGITSFALGNGIGAIIRRQQSALAGRLHYSAKDLVLVIKPAMDARYGDVVAALDEVLINDVKHYAFVDLEPSEKERLVRLGIK